MIRYPATSTSRPPRVQFLGADRMRGAHTFSIFVLLTTRLQPRLHVLAGMGWDELRLPNPVRPDDVLDLEVSVLEKRESKSKSDRGIVRNQILLRNQSARDGAAVYQQYFRSRGDRTLTRRSADLPPNACQAWICPRWITTLPGRNLFSPSSRIRDASGQLRQLIYDPNCEMAHRQEPFSLVVLSGWPLLGGLGSERATRSRKRLRHEIELTKTQLCYGPSGFVLGGSLCAVSIARPLWCASLSFLSPP